MSIDKHARNAQNYGKYTEKCCHGVSVVQDVGIRVVRTSSCSARMSSANFDGSRPIVRALSSSDDPSSAELLIDVIEGAGASREQDRRVRLPSAVGAVSCLPWSGRLRTEWLQRSAACRGKVQHLGVVVGQTCDVVAACR